VREKKIQLIDNTDTTIDGNIADSNTSNDFDSTNNRSTKLSTDARAPFEVYPEFKEALLHYRTWHVCLMVALSMCQGVFISYVFKSFGEDQINDDAFITTVGTVGSIMNGASRSFWATIQDKLGYKRIYFPILIIQMCIGFSFYFVSKSKPLFLIWVSISYF
jgi:Na+/melibiose symporter-like transporter